LARRVRPIALSPGEELFAAGSEPGGVYLVTEGTLEVYAPRLPTTTLTAGAVAGLGAALERRVANATVIAGASAQVVCLDTDELDALLAASPALNEALWRMAAARRGFD
jgi:CRP-like cAMP-binding protein